MPNFELGVRRAFVIKTFMIEACIGSRERVDLQIDFFGAVQFEDKAWQKLIKPVSLLIFSCEIVF